MGVSFIRGRVDAHLERGRIYLRQGRFTQAAVEFQTATDRNRKDVEAYIGLAQVAAAQERYDLALLHLAKARQLDSTSPTVLNLTLQIYLETGKLDLAIRTAEEAFAVNPGSSIAKLLGFAYIQKGELQKAERVLKYALKLEPDKALYFQLAEVYVRQGQLHKAEDAYQRIHERYPDDLRGYIMLGRTLDARQYYPQAIAVYESLLAQYEPG